MLTDAKKRIRGLYLAVPTLAYSVTVDEVPSTLRDHRF